MAAREDVGGGEGGGVVDAAEEEDLVGGGDEEDAADEGRGEFRLDMCVICWRCEGLCVHGLGIGYGSFGRGLG